MYGLLGKTLKHSFSKDIHEALSDVNYTLYETDDLEEFFQNTPFKGLNVTIPYKHDVISFLDELSEEAEALQAVNTIIRRSGKLYGYNTDYYGLENTLKRSGITVQNKDVLILGNGSTSRTIQYYCKQNLAKKITVLARNPNQNEYHFTSVENFKSTSIVFNATPVGMFPDNDGVLPIDLISLPNVVSVVDVIYNPLRSNLLIAAEKRGIQTVNGLFMLISQAVKALELFHNIDISSDIIESYYKSLLLKQSNLVLIGMPMSGKSYFAKRLAKHYHKKVLELDQAIEEYAGMPIPNIFALQGEDGFRNIESKLVFEYSKQHNKAISTGGGVVLNPENIRHLKQNGILIFLDMPLEMLQECNPKDRPLLQNRKNLEKLYYSRYDLYNDYADIVVQKTTFDAKKTQQLIEVKLDAYLSS
jgi:shikimate dehydrogenase